jgi:ABC-type nitrate/sulfonate/bicarbonate transport system permease component
MPFFLSLWEVLVRTNVIDPFFLPAPTQVIDKAIQMTTTGMGVGPQQHIEIIYKTLKSCVK